MRWVMWRISPYIFRGQDIYVYRHHNNRLYISLNEQLTDIDLSQYSFVIFGNSRFGGYYHREQAIAHELAKRGYQVVFIEEMPSLAAELRRQFRRMFSKQAIDEQLVGTELLDNMKVMRPPVIPNLFRSRFYTDH